MRLLFLFLLLLNGLIYFWYSFNQKPVNAAPTMPTVDAPQLVLLSEQTEIVTESISDNLLLDDMQDSEEPDPDLQTRCYTLGPFMNKESVTEATERLMLSGRPFEKRVSEKKEQIGYWVYLPPFVTLGAAREKAQEFKLLGDKHFYVVKTPSEYANAISLGVFKAKANAERRHRQIKNLGYDALLEGRFRQNPVYWLDFSEHAESPEFDSSELLGAQRLPRVCESVASAAPLQ